MKASRFVDGYAVVLATALLASCGSGSPSLLAHSSGVSGTPQAQSMLPSRGGAFRAAYAGTYTLGTCSAVHHNGSFQFSGTGSASFLYKSSEMGTMYSYYIPTGCGGWGGSAVLTNTRHPRDSITVSLHGRGSQYAYPCTGGQNLCSFSVTGGAGRFAHATGSGTVKMTYNNGTYTDAWSGTLQF